MNYKKMFIKTLYKVLDYRRELFRTVEMLSNCKTQYVVQVPTDMFCEIFSDGDIEYYSNVFLDEFDIKSNFTIWDVADFVNKYEIPCEDDIAEVYEITYFNSDIENEIVKNEIYLEAIIQMNYDETLAKEVSKWSDLAEIGSVFEHEDFLITLTTNEIIKENE